MRQPFSTRLRKWRGNLSQRQAAIALGVPVGTYRKWEYGERVPNAYAMAEVERRMHEK